ncbi:hypothetical protein ACPPVO_19510 [Dactylosporangium sp. McL0621]|uniref:hypothetical protein n=1 Tax=Dactylosporangium sp. McL0621 TaxID=3415678 RepID=UPI003CE681A8
MDVGEELYEALARYAEAGADHAINAEARDAYDGLRVLLNRRLAGRPHAQAVVDSPYPERDALRDRLGNDLADSGADRDTEILAAARRLSAALGDKTLRITTNYGAAAVTMTGPVTVNYGSPPHPFFPGTA